MCLVTKMKLSFSKPLILAAGTLLASVSLAQTAATNRPADQAFREAKSLYEQKNYVPAEASCKQAVDLYEQAGENRLSAHLLLGKIFYKTRRLEEAYEEVTTGWRPGRNSEQDLLVAVVGSQLHKGRAVQMAYSALTNYLEVNGPSIASSIPDRTLLPSRSQLRLGAPGATKALTYAASVLISTLATTEPQERLDWLTEPDSTPLVAYLKGTTEKQLGNLREARIHLEFAATNGTLKLKEAAQRMLGSDFHCINTWQRPVAG